MDEEKNLRTIRQFLRSTSSKDHKMVKQLLGIIFLCTFISFLGYKFYNTVKYMEYAGVITFLCALILIVVLLGVGKQLRGY